ncbi:MAG: hypothetical protein R3Y36_02030 [Spirochaetales bacterium]
MNDFLSKMKDLAGKGVEVSKDFFDQAGETVQSWTDKGVTKFELMQLDRQAQKQFARLGICVFEAFEVEDRETVSKKNKEIADIVAEIIRLKDEIHKRDENKAE